MKNLVDYHFFDKVRMHFVQCARALVSSSVEWLGISRAYASFKRKAFSFCVKCMRGARWPSIEIERAQIFANIGTNVWDSNFDSRSYIARVLTHLTDRTAAFNVSSFVLLTKDQRRYSTSNAAHEGFWSRTNRKQFQIPHGTARFAIIPSRTATSSSSSFGVIANFNRNCWSYYSKNGLFSHFEKVNT